MPLAMKAPRYCSTSLPHRPQASTRSSPSAGPTGGTGAPSLRSAGPPPARRRGPSCGHDPGQGSGDLATPDRHAVRRKLLHDLMAGALESENEFVKALGRCVRKVVEDD